MRKLQEDARVLYREEVASHTFRLGLDCPEIAGLAHAGQFVMLRVREGADPLLRRPFSFHRIFPERGEFELLFRVVGRGTLLLSQLAAGARVNVAGPLGNGFQLPLDRTLSLALIAGGIGIAPLFELILQIASERTEKDIGLVHLFYGARTAADLLPEDALAPVGITLHRATDDGSSGYRGLVTRLFEDHFAESGSNPAEIYSCGPLAMQHRVAQWALANDVLAQLSLESLMACGIGACLGCALPAADSSQFALNTAVRPESLPRTRSGVSKGEHTAHASIPQHERDRGQLHLERKLVSGGPASGGYVHVCEDGPIFTAGSIEWSKIQVQQMPRPAYLFS